MWNRSVDEFDGGFTVLWTNIDDDNLVKTDANIEFLFRHRAYQEAD